MKEHPELRFGAGLADVRERWPVSSSEVVHETGRVISVRRDTVAPADGDSFVRDVVVHPGAVGVVALDEQNRMLLVRQYRHPVGYRLIEPPAGSTVSRRTEITRPVSCTTSDEETGQASRTSASPAPNRSSGCSFIEL